MSSTSSSTTAEQRLLAVVFTDVAGFSSRVETREADTLTLLDRDFAAMRTFCTQRGGTIIKSTGDGLMLYFTSAVEAVEWALQAQRHFAAQAKTLAADEILKHRIGIHLGDVVVGGGDIMGDGVNVAARVQTEARPGGICISQVVYGVVKNKLKLDVIRLEPRKLKNINEAVQMYHVLLEPPVRRADDSAADEAPVFKPAARPGTSSRNWIVAGALGLVLAGAGGALLQMHRAHQRELAESAAQRTTLVTLEKPAAATATPAAAVAATLTPASTAPADPIANAPAKPAPEEINFLKLTTSRPAAAGVSAAQDAALRSTADAIAVLDAWRTATLSRYTKDRPLAVPSLRGRRGRTLFVDAAGQLVFAEGGATRKLAWADLKAEEQGAIIASLLNDPSLPPPKREVLRGAEAFAFVHGLPELAAQLAHP